MQHKPKLIIAGGSAYPRFIDFPRIRAIADVGRRVISWSIWRISPGWSRPGCIPSPLPHAHVVTSTTHKTLRGPRGGLVLTNHEEIAKKINSAIFPGLQGGPLMHVIAAKAVAFGEALRPDFTTYQKAVSPTPRRWPRPWSNRASPSSPAARIRICSWSISARSTSPARPPRRAWSARISPRTRTPSRSIRKSRSSPQAFAWARPPRRRAVSASRSSARSG